MKVKVRAVIVVEGQLVVVRESRRGSMHVSLPGGRVNDRESVHAALRREVREETALEIEVGPLLYVAEVMASGIQDVNIVFEATPLDSVGASELDLVPLDAEAEPDLMPPLLPEIARDAATGWSGTPRWLGNVRVPVG